MVFILDCLTDFLHFYDPTFRFSKCNSIKFLVLMPKLCANMQMQEIYSASGYFLEGESAKEKKIP